MNESKLKIAVMALVCSRMNSEDFAHLKEIFAEMDKNGDGYLSLDEVKLSMSQAKVDLSILEDLFRKMVTSQSVQINYTGK